MESKDPLLPLSGLSGLRSRTRIPPINIDSTTSRTHISLIAAADRDSSSSPSASMSPPTPVDNDPLSASTEPPLSSPSIEGALGGREPASGPQRARSGSSVSKTTGKAGDSREKRKRSRVTPEQLTHLERFFASDRSPTAARRKEISDLLGMQERQTQIWFQNRRAKAKLLEGKKSRQSGGEWSDTPPDTPPQLSAGYEADLHSLIHEDHPVSIIPCTDLSIGNWRRIATGKHDLVAYVCEAKRCLTWFIHSSGYGFKMDIPFDTISHTDFRHAGPGEGLASFTLNQPPQFFLEQILSPRSGGSMSNVPVKTWKKCSDWTEGSQATLVLHHDLVGSAVQLAHVLQDLRNYRTRASLPLISPASYSATGELVSPAVPSPIAMQIPQPPLASLQGRSYTTQLQAQQLLAHSRKRSSSDPSLFAHDPHAPYGAHDYSQAGMEGSSHVMENMGPRSAGYASSSSFSHLPLERPTPLTTAVSYPQGYAPRSAVEYLPQGSHSSPPLQHDDPAGADYSTVPISHASMHRPSFSGAPPQYVDTRRNSPPYPSNPLQHEPDPSGMVSHSHYATTSSPVDSPFRAPPAGENISRSGSSSLHSVGGLAQPATTSASTGDGSMVPQGIPYYAHETAPQSQPQYRTSPSRLDSGSLSGALGSASSSSASPTGPRQMMPPSLE